jgi:hypothetical protein
MNRSNLFCKAVRNTPVHPNEEKPVSVAWGKINFGNINFENIGGAVVFAALLLICSLAVGCSSDKPKTENTLSQSTNQPMPTVATSPAATPVALAVQAVTKPEHKKVVHQAPATASYADKTSGVSFQYPRKYTLKTGDAADELVSSDPVPMNFAQPGGVALALVALPESAFPKSDLAWAFFDVSMNRALSEEQCGEFSQTKPVTSADASTSVAGPDAAPTPKLMIGDLELQSTETVASQGKNEEAAKYYHVFENGACYEFALKVATSGVGDRPQQARGSRGSVRTAGENSGHGENQSSAGSDGNCTGGSSDEWSEPSTVIARAVLVARVRGQALPANSYHEDNCRTIAAMSFS